MEESVDQQLIALLQDTRAEPRAAGTHLAVERYLAELVGGQQAQRISDSGPDILVGREDARPLAIELKVLSRRSFPKNFRNRVSEMLADSVRIRRSFRDEASVAAVVLLYGDANGVYAGQNPGSLLLSWRLSLFEPMTVWDLTLC
ncbi:hypothetical protein P9139_04265 [Curtobacterium flaccumfaciens]|nr:hypothetical protein P9139_04265 [Curtobacterium flaccumfaciens]